MGKVCMEFYRSIMSFYVPEITHTIPEGALVARYENSVKLLLLDSPSDPSDIDELLTTGVPYTTPATVTWIYPIEPPPLGTDTTHFEVVCNPIYSIGGGGGILPPAPPDCCHYMTVPFISQTIVVVDHGFGVYPEVQVIDNSSAVIIPESIVHSTVNSLTVTFSGSTSGTVIVSA